MTIQMFAVEGPMSRRVGDVRLALSSVIGALDLGLQAERRQPDVVVAISPSVLRPAPISEDLSPLPMGTEQQVRIPRP